MYSLENFYISPTDRSTAFRSKYFQGLQQAPLGPSQDNHSSDLSHKLALPGFELLINDVTPSLSWILKHLIKHIIAEIAEEKEAIGSDQGHMIYLIYTTEYQKGAPEKRP